MEKDTFVKWALELGFATGHADTEQDLLNEVGAQIRELQSNAADKSDDCDCQDDWAFNDLCESCREWRGF